MRPVMRIQLAALKDVLLGTTVGIAVVGGAGPAGSQALLVEPLPGGAQLVVVNQPLADATTIVWPATPGDPRSGQVTAGRLTIAAELEAALAAADWEAPPPVIVAVGGAAAQDLTPLLTRAIGDRAAWPVEPSTAPGLAEGGLDRRLGAPGGDAQLRLEVALPPPADWRRSSIEVLWELVPALLADKAPFLQSRVEGQLGILDGRVDPELAELMVSELRLALARVAADPALDEADVVEARQRLGIRRLALLDNHPGAAHLVLDAWLAGGEEAVRQVLFGIHGVTLASVREAAAQWLPLHPGRAQLILPPTVFNPRFAAGPEVHRLANDVTTAVLERGGSPMAVVCLRPVLVPDLDGEVTATVLARLARELRAAARRPGFVGVRASPPLIEIAGPADGLGELVEQLTTAYAAVLADDASLTAAGDDARRRALDLMAGVLGLTDFTEVSPATLLRPGNLAVGVVAPDAETAAEALRKFWSAAPPPPTTADVEAVPTDLRTRVAAPGDESVVVVALDMELGGSEVPILITRELLESRARARWPEARAEVLAPYVPGRSILLLVLAAERTVGETEAALAAEWRRLTAAPSDDELAPIKRRVAAAVSAEMSGVTGHARRCAAVAAGASDWRQPAELELEVMTVEASVVGEALGRIGSLEELPVTGAGALPKVDRSRR
jgi:hypothetical protein